MSVRVMTDEQKNIVETLNHSNVLVNAVAGSGKTTTILFLAQHYVDKQIMVITYNAKLRIETIKRCDKMNMKNIEVHTYHSFCRKYYHRSCKTDTEIREFVNGSKNVSLKPFYFDILVLDEVQDMNFLYYHFVIKTIKMLKNKRLIDL